MGFRRFVILRGRIDERVRLWAERASVGRPRISGQRFRANGRGGAWVARASDPLAAFFNPAALAGQETALTVQANIDIQSTCFTRIKAAGDTTVEPAANAAGQFPRVCNDAKPFPNPQFAFNYRVSDRIGVGLAVTWAELLRTLAVAGDRRGTDCPPRSAICSSSKTRSS